MTWWQWLVLIAVLGLSIPFCLVVSRLLDKLDVEWEPSNNQPSNKEDNNHV